MHAYSSHPSCSQVASHGQFGVYSGAAPPVHTFPIHSWRPTVYLELIQALHLFTPFPFTGGISRFISSSCRRCTSSSHHSRSGRWYAPLPRYFRSLLSAGGVVIRVVVCCVVRVVSCVVLLWCCSCRVVCLLFLLCVCVCDLCLFSQVAPHGLFGAHPGAAPPVHTFLFTDGLFGAHPGAAPPVHIFPIHRWRPTVYLELIQTRHRLFTPFLFTDGLFRAHPGAARPVYTFPIHTSYSHLSVHRWRPTVYLELIQALHLRRSEQLSAEESACRVGNILAQQPVCHSPTPNPSPTPTPTLTLS